MSRNQKQPRKKAGCTECNNLVLSKLAAHYLDRHTDFHTTITLRDENTLIHHHKSTDNGILCPFSCARYYTGRNDFMSHLRQQIECTIPDFQTVSSSKKVPSLPALEDITNVPKTLKTYDEAISSTILKQKDQETLERITRVAVQGLGLVPYGTHNETDGEEISFTTAEILENIINKYQGKKVNFSKKRKEAETVDDEEDHGKKRAMKHISSDQAFSTIVLNGPYANTLKNRKYFELNDNISELINTCWLSTPQVKYFATRLMAGAILLNSESSEGVLITTAETYGRTSSLDPHRETNNASYPPPEQTRYPNVYPITDNTQDGSNKLLIGTKQLNYLITGSVRVDSNHPPEVGPSTSKFQIQSEDSSRDISIFLDEKVYLDAKRLWEDSECDGVGPSQSIYQLRQIRSKFNEIQTYTRLRATWDLIDAPHSQPLSIFTLCNYEKGLTHSNDNEEPANYKLGSLIFMEVASEILNKQYKARLHKDVVDSIFLKFKTPTQRIPTLVKSILDLYENDDDEIRIISNNSLNRILGSIAELLSSQICKSNADIVKNITTSITKK